ncbi:MAG: helix-turn-helix domain-containing protein [Nannocystaceae bacterium]
MSDSRGKPARRSTHRTSPAPMTPSIDIRDPSSWPVVLDADEVAAVLRRPRREVQRLARVGKVPGAFRSGRYWRFRAGPLRRWLQGTER